MTKRHGVLTEGHQQDFQLIQNTSLSIQSGFHLEQPAEISNFKQHVHVASSSDTNMPVNNEQKKMDSSKKVEARRINL